MRARRLIRLRRMGVAALLTVWAGISIVDARQQRPLPAFQVEAADGRTESSEALSAEPQWLIVYVTPQCPACDRLLDALAEARSPVALARTVVIVAGEPAAVGAYVVRRHAAAPSMRFYADGQMQASQALGLTGGPALAGIRRGQIEWVLMGVLNDPDAVEPVMRTWVEY